MDPSLGGGKEAGAATGGTDSVDFFLANLFDKGRGVPRPFFSSE
jgi:hypothetical protein